MQTLLAFCIFLNLAGFAAFRRALNPEMSSALSFEFCFERFFCPPKPNFSFLYFRFGFGLKHKAHK